MSFRREAHVPRGGPDGGDGGDGGAVIFVATNNLNTLVDYSLNSSRIAKNGVPGSENQKHGANGKSIECMVPTGTQVFYNDIVVADLSVDGARWIAARGGKGGKGNVHYKSASNQVPQYAQKGIEGDSRKLKLVLKSIADVGLVGFPNVGKSTLLSHISRSHAQIADYPFTTLTPNLGVVLLDEEQRYVVADVPGLIGGAHTGKGLGSQFLQHLERTKALAQIVDLTIDNNGHKRDWSAEAEDDEVIAAAKEQLQQIEQELEGFSPELIKKPRIVVFNKSDYTVNARAYELMKDSIKIESILVSSHHESNIETLKFSLLHLINSQNQDSIEK